MTEQSKIVAQHKNVHVALAAAQLEFGTVTKGSTNPAFKSKYADLSDVASVVIPVLARHGVCVVHYLTGEGLSAMRTEFVHGESETRVACDVPLLVDRQNMQGMKSATTYAKRIGLESLSGVAPEDDDGNAAAQAAPQRQARQEQRQSRPADDGIAHATASLAAAATLDALKAIWTDLPPAMKTAPAVIEAKEARKNALTAAQDDALAGDLIPY
jgi:hypothetical protein